MHCKTCCRSRMTRKTPRTVPTPRHAPTAASPTRPRPWADSPSWSSFTPCAPAPSSATWPWRVEIVSHGHCKPADQSGSIWTHTRRPRWRACAYLHAAHVRRRDLWGAGPAHIARAVVQLQQRRPSRSFWSSARPSGSHHRGRGAIRESPRPTRGRRRWSDSLSQAATSNMTWLQDDAWICRRRAS